MKTTKFVILLPLSILLIGIVNANPVAQSEKTIWSPSCLDLKIYLVKFGNQSDDFDIIAAFLNFFETCKRNYNLEFANNKFVDKQIKLMSECIEMPEKLKKNEELWKKECSQKLDSIKMVMKKFEEEALNECSKAEDVNGNETKLAFQRECDQSNGPWKVLTFTFMGIIAALVLFIIGAVVYFCKYRSNGR